MSVILTLDADVKTRLQALHGGGGVCSYTLVSFSFFSFFLPQHLFAAEIFLGPRGEHIPLLTVVQSLTIADPPSPSDSPDSVNALKGKLSKLSGQCSAVNQLRYQSTFITSRILTLQRMRSQIMWSHKWTYSLLFGVIAYLDKLLVYSLYLRFGVSTRHKNNLL